MISTTLTPGDYMQPQNPVPQQIFPQNQMQQGYDQNQYQYYPQVPPTAPISNEKMEELIEAVIDEKWADLIKNVEKIIEWKEHVDGQIVEMNTKFTELKDSFSRLETGVLKKVGDYDQNVKDVGVELKALEKVFSKMLPTFTENVSELSRLTENLKKNK